MADSARRDRSGLGPRKRKERVRPESTSRVLARAGSSDTRNDKRRRAVAQQEGEASVRERKAGNGGGEREVEPCRFGEGEGWEREALPPDFGRTRAAQLGHARWLAGPSGSATTGAARQRGAGAARAATARARARGTVCGDAKFAGGGSPGRERWGEGERENEREEKALGLAWRRLTRTRVQRMGRARGKLREREREREMGREINRPTEPEGGKLDFYRGI
uniref:p0696G06.22 protein n=1 Tax=Oryza sativa subsp. japonica TaxID=39947 RepID=Q8L427_ORYSJ|nr:P0696G06.22 [Oryza sativa Japonica Group]